jgi:hypothetical protein
MDLPVMAVAIGIYLPFTLTLPIMIGGILKFGTDSFATKKVEFIDKKEEDINSEECTDRISKLKKMLGNRGILFASGLIAGEAILGVVIAAIVIGGIDLSLIGEAALWPGALVFSYLIILIVYILLREILKSMNFIQLKLVIKGMIGDTFNYVKSVGRKK